MLEFTLITLTTQSEYRRFVYGDSRMSTLENIITKNIKE